MSDDTWQALLARLDALSPERRERFYKTFFEKAGPGEREVAQEVLAPLEKEQGGDIGF